MVNQKTLTTRFSMAQEISKALAQDFPNLFSGYQSESSIDDVIESVFFEAYNKPSFHVNYLDLQNNLRDCGNLLDRLLQARREYWGLEAERLSIGMHYRDRLALAVIDAAVGAKSYPSASAEFEAKASHIKQDIFEWETRHKVAKSVFNYKERLAKLKHMIRRDVESLACRARAVHSGVLNIFNVSIQPDDGRRDELFEGAGLLDVVVDWHRLISRKCEGAFAQAMLHQLTIPLCTTYPGGTVIAQVNMPGPVRLPPIQGTGIILLPDFIAKLKNNATKFEFQLNDYSLHNYQVFPMPRWLKNPRVVRLRLIASTDNEAGFTWSFVVKITAHDRVNAKGVTLTINASESVDVRCPSVLGINPRCKWTLELLGAMTSKPNPWNLATDHSPWPLVDVRLLMDVMDVTL